MTQKNEESGKEKDLNINPQRNPFSKPDNERQNLHSLDADRNEIAGGDPSFDNRQEEDFQSEPWKKKQ